MLAAFAERGVEAIGIDISPSMVVLARERLSSPGLPAEALVADMTSFDLGRTFGGAICPIDTLACLEDPASVVKHLDCMAAHLRPGMRGPAGDARPGRSLGRRATFDLGGGERRHPPSDHLAGRRDRPGRGHRASALTNRDRRRAEPRTSLGGSTPHGGLDARPVDRHRRRDSLHIPGCLRRRRGRLSAATHSGKPGACSGTNSRSEAQSRRAAPGRGAALLRIGLASRPSGSTRGPPVR